MDCSDQSSKLARLLEKAAEARSNAEQYEALCAAYATKRLLDQLGPYDSVRYAHDSKAAEGWRRREADIELEIVAEEEAERQRQQVPGYGSF